MLNFAQFIKPDIGFVSRADEEWAINTMRGADRIESKGKEFHSKVHHYFNNLSEAPSVLSSQPFWPKVVKPLPIIPSHSEEEVSNFVTNFVERSL
jgi:hypothetical protein